MSQSPLNSVLPTTTIAIRADHKVYRAYREGQNPETLFQEAMDHISAISSRHFRPTMIKDLSRILTRAIYGSNMIEHAGLNLANTTYLCEQLFSGHTPPATPPLQLSTSQPDLNTKSLNDITIAQNEVIQHAKAYIHMINSFVIDKQDLTEDLIKSTHKILTTNIPIRSVTGPDIPPSNYSGVYRKVGVTAGNNSFCVPQAIPKNMAEMCAEYKSDLATAEKQGYIDPFSFAAKYSLQFVMIHPFLDGNGRMCRIILNAILCRFAGPGGIGMIAIGEDKDEREEYMGIKKRAGDEMEGHGEYATFVLERCVWQLRRMRQVQVHQGEDV